MAVLFDKDGVPPLLVSLICFFTLLSSTNSLLFRAPQIKTDDFQLSLFRLSTKLRSPNSLYDSGQIKVEEMKSEKKKRECQIGGRISK